MAVRVADRLPTVKVAAVTCFTQAPLSTDLPADVLAKLSLWRPPVWDIHPDDSGDLETLVWPTVRCWVAAAHPDSVSMVREMLRVTSGFGAWIFGVSATVDVRMLCPANVEYWAFKVNAHKSLVWRHHTRWLLRQVGRAVFPDGWVEVPVGEPIGRRPPSSPYMPGDEAAFRLSARLPARVEPAGRRWVVAATLGAGLLSPAVAAAETGDLVNLGNDRLGIRVGGTHPRVVPIRHDYTSLVREAVELADGGQFVTATHRTAVYMLCRQVGISGRTLSVRRARSTWLVAHLHAGTSLSVLRRIAGPLPHRQPAEPVQADPRFPPVNAEVAEAAGNLHSGRHTDVRLDRSPQPAVEHGHGLARYARRGVGPDPHPGVELQIPRRSGSTKPGSGESPHTAGPHPEQPPSLPQRPGGALRSAAGKQLGQVVQGGDHPVLVLLPQRVDHPDERTPDRPRVRPVHQVGMQLDYEDLTIGGPCPIRSLIPDKPQTSWPLP